MRKIYVLCCLVFTLTLISCHSAATETQNSSDNGQINTTVATSFADYHPDGDNTVSDFIYSATLEGFVVERHLGGNTDIFVPSEVNGHRITTINHECFQNQPIEKVEIAEGIVEIEYKAFNGCEKLTDVRLPESLLRMSSNVFNGTPWFNELCRNADDGFVIADGWLLAYLGDDANIVVPEKVIHIASSVFEHNEAVTSVRLPEGLKTIGTRAFAGCVNLNSIVIPESVVEMGDKVFSESGLRDITILNKELQVSYLTFSETPFMADDANYDGEFLIVNDCLIHYKGLDTPELWEEGEVEVLIPPYVRHINMYFYGVYETIVIPDGVEHVRDILAWDGLVRRLSFPDSVKSIAAKAITHTYLLECVQMPQGVDVGVRAFYATGYAADPDNADENGLLTLGNLLLGYYGDGRLEVPPYIQNIAMNVYEMPPTHENITELILHDGVKAIDDSSFIEAKIEELTLPGSIKYLGGYPFYGCEELRSVIIEEGVPYISSGMFRECTSLEEILIPDSVVYIDRDAFSGCVNLKKIIIPDSVAYIDESAFKQCTSLTEVIISDGKLIHSTAFEGCPWQPDKSKHRFFSDEE